MRIDFKNVRPLYKLKLLGVSINQYLSEGKFLLSKFDNDNYNLSYFQLKFAQLFGIDRPIKLIEKNKNVKGRRKQNELKMDIVFKGVAKIKTEVIFLNNIPIKSSDFKAYKESDSDLPFELTKYDPDFWNGYNIIEPSEVLKSFKIEKN